MNGTPEETIVFTRPPEISGIEIMRVENSTRLWRVFHETYTICTVLPCKAWSEWIYRGKTLEAHQRGIMLMEPGETHVNTKSTGAGRFYVMTVRAQQVERMVRELGFHTTQPHFKRNEIYDSDLFNAFADFYRSLERPSTVLERQSRFILAIRRLFEGHAEEGTRVAGDAYSHRAVRKAREYIRERFSEEINLSELAAFSGLSPSHLVRLFTRKLGVAPHAYQIGVRLERARELLGAGLSAAQVAASLGFYDQSHFIAQFKRAHGLTPGHYLSQIRGSARGF